MSDTTSHIGQKCLKFEQVQALPFEEYLACMEYILLQKKKSKEKILREGGERAFGHSQADIVRIDFAIGRIKEKQYGFCCHCGLIINPQRLWTLPETPFCERCAHDVARSKN